MILLEVPYWIERDFDLFNEMKAGLTKRNVRFLGKAKTKKKPSFPGNVYYNIEHADRAMYPEDFRDKADRSARGKAQRVISDIAGKRQKSCAAGGGK